MKSGIEGVISGFLRHLATLERQIFPPRCALDAGPASRFDLADELVEQLRPVLDAPHCPRCATNTPDGYLCAACLHSPPAFDRVLAAYWLDDTLKTLLHRMKYGRRPDFRITRLLSELMAEQLPRWQPRAQALLPVPLHPNRLRERGFNQSSWLARDLGRAFDLPCLPARRLRDTPHQAQLHGRLRRRSLHGAFAASESVAGYDTIAIVDDVLTTGHTAHALAQAIKAIRPDMAVEVWVLARTELL